MADSTYDDDMSLFVAGERDRTCTSVRNARFSKHVDGMKEGSLPREESIPPRFLPSWAADVRRSDRTEEQCKEYETAIARFYYEYMEHWNLQAENDENLWAEKKAEAAYESYGSDKLDTYIERRAVFEDRRRRTVAFRFMVGKQGGIYREQDRERACALLSAEFGDYPDYKHWLAENFA